MLTNYKGKTDKYSFFIMKLLDNVALTIIFIQEIFSTDVLDDLAEAITGTITKKVKEAPIQNNSKEQWLV